MPDARYLRFQFPSLACPYGGMNVDDAKRLRELEAKKATLKRLRANSEVENAALKEIAKG